MEKGYKYRIYPNKQQELLMQKRLNYRNKKN
ncbi:helix-turn-helix domain-containing protein [Armatimonadetes bacterium]|nr:helix-turn-helix domain-containing protein [bacterium]